MKKLSQCDRMLKILKRKGRHHRNTFIRRGLVKWTNRISDLRARGYVINYEGDGWYRMVQ